MSRRIISFATIDKLATKRVIIPAALESRFRDLVRFTYEVKTPEEALHMVETVFRECGEAVDQYDEHAFGPLCLPAMEAALDALATLVVHYETTGQASEAAQKVAVLNREIKKLLDEKAEGTFTIPQG